MIGLWMTATPETYVAAAKQPYARGHSSVRSTGTDSMCALGEDSKENSLTKHEFLHF